MIYSIEALTSGCYEGTSCLINKFGIRDQSALDEIEAAITMAKAAEIAEYIGLKPSRVRDYLAELIAGDIVVADGANRRLKA